MENFVEYTYYFDVYQDLLNEKEITYFKDYYFHNLSLQEIAENSKVSRNAVHKRLKSAVQKLLAYEKTLKLVEKNNALDSLLDDIETLSYEEIKKQLEKIRW